LLITIFLFCDPFLDKAAAVAISHIIGGNITPKAKPYLVSRISSNSSAVFHSVNSAFYLHFQAESTSTFLFLLLHLPFPEV
jgi:hypothetical protein